MTIVETCGDVYMCVRNLWIGVVILKQSVVVLEKFGYGILEWILA